MRPHRLATFPLLALSLSACGAPDGMDFAAPVCAVEQALDVRVRDAAGRLIERRRAADDGAPDVRRWTYDAEGRPTHFEADGLRAVRAWEGDRLVALEVDEDGDRWRLDLTWDADGRLVALDGEGPISFALVEQTIGQFYDSYLWAFGPPLLPDVDLAPDLGLFERVYGDEGRRPTALSVTYAYDEAGRLIEVRWDEGADGRLESIRRAHAEGDVWVVELDLGADGVVDRRHRETYDAAGALRTQQVDEDADGQAERSRLLTETADRRVEARDEDGDGVIDHTTVVHLDAAGRRVLKEELDADGRVTWRKTYAYDAEGRRTVDRRDADVDGVIDQVTTYAYAAEGDGEVVTETTRTLSPSGCSPGEGLE